MAGLQNMLDVFTVYGNEFDIGFNAKKCMFMVVGKRLMRSCVLKRVISLYSVSQKKVAPLKLFAILSLLVNLCN